MDLKCGYILYVYKDPKLNVIKRGYVKGKWAGRGVLVILGNSQLWDRREKRKKKTILSSEAQV